MSNNLIIQVDDDDDDHFLLQEALNEVGSNAELKRVRSCSELMNFLQTSNNLAADVILLDVNLSPENGFSCLKQINSDETISQIPVVIFTTSVHPDAIEEAYQNGAACFIAKPFSFDKLKSIARNLSMDHVQSLDQRQSREKFLISF